MKEVQVWTDGACEPNPGYGGWGYHMSTGDFAYGGEGNTTNNRMEMLAILKALQAIRSGSVTIFSDSQYCVNGLTVWRPKWKKAKWMRKGEPLKNRDLWLALEAEIIRLNPMVQWVRGHNGNPGNERADKLAGMGRKALLRFEGVAA